ncbi:MAG: sigma 54-dependent Fis family transcriptional regulator [Myxococcales bacterium]|nr:sigma 54-dependent Fis family transcriptional regulator [Myxococcales bacterium]
MSDTTKRLAVDLEGARFYRRKYRLEVLSGPDRGKSLDTAAESVTVGSARWNELMLDSSAVSRHHLRIKITPDGFQITDLDSTNGTWLGAVRLQQALVQGAVDLKLGDTMLRLLPLSEEEEVPITIGTEFGGLVGKSPTMRELFRKLEAIARQDVTVLIDGETGTGKELVARELHNHSPRAEGPFVVVDCGAIPPALVESELFGYTAGAYTGATESRAGPFEEAERGTIFLDEIGELPLELQPKLLRVLERKEVKRVGEHHHRAVDVRIIAATNRDLARLVNSGAFRGDLYYRLAVVSLSLPPLRQRAEDLDLLIANMWPDVCGVSGATPNFDPETLAMLTRHPWPGNVRELRNVLERISVFPDAPPNLDSSTDPARVTAPLHTRSEESQISDLVLDAMPLRQARAMFERRYLARLLEANSGNVAEAARHAGIDRVHLYRLIKKHGLRRD